jgi:hypothetical protein
MSAGVGTNSEEKPFVFKAWVNEGIEGIKPKWSPSRKHMLPEGFHTHMEAAKQNMKGVKKECLLAVRSFIDDAIERTEAEPPKRATKVKVE